MSVPSYVVWSQGGVPGTSTWYRGTVQYTYLRIMDRSSKFLYLLPYCTVPTGMLGSKYQYRYLVPGRCW
jgi:hypothetical protein